eukprot:gnl/MRDRNA2_/MRDRNA2_105699_c0_seq1.p1 gnl/MRDRNA2_/MRDRNA2_105699_c0~~gnl/MRDRNA2_/MRDRNA2_105699_c0_seq1.p1  ORF type:complete len:564 (+),score=120.84 gnl/MRDRNA2_/MRDRNA2_105699_c0_seq1:155-1846(+)
MWFAAVFLPVALLTRAEAARLRRNAPIFHVENDNIGGMRVLYAAPPGAKVPKPSVPGMPPPDPAGLKGVAMLFHACGRNSADWFQLPEESQMVQKLFERGFAVVAPTEGPNAPGGCWVPAVDTTPVYSTMHTFLTTRGLDKLPLYGIGLSSGGGMAASLQYAGMKFAGLHLNSSPGGAKKNNPGYFARPGFPPTSFVYFTADNYASPDDVRTAETALTLNHVPVQVLELQPKPVEELATRVQAAGMDQETGMKLVKQLESWNLVENRYGQNFMMMMTADQALNRLLATPAWNPLVAKSSKTMYEELHLVEGVHGPSVEYFDQSLDFLTDPTHNAALHEPPAPGQAPAVPNAPATPAAAAFSEPPSMPTGQPAQMPVSQPPAAPFLAPGTSPPAPQFPAPVTLNAAPPVVPAHFPVVTPVAATAPKGKPAAVAQNSANAVPVGGMTCSKRATGQLDGSLSQRVLMLSPTALSLLEAHDVELGGKVSYLCTCLKVRIESRPASQTAEAALMMLGGQTLTLPDEGRTAESPDIDLRAAKVVLCHGEAESECKQCASWDPFVQPRKR